MRLRHLSCAVLLTAAGCGSTAPTVTEVSGFYHAVVFMTTENGVTTDQLLERSSLVMRLLPDGTMTGHLAIPADSVSENIGGTWALNGDKVTFVQQADTFVRDLTFTAMTNTLLADQTIGAVRIRIRLEKS